MTQMYENPLQHTPTHKHHHFCPQYTRSGTRKYSNENSTGSQSEYISQYLTNPPQSVIQNYDNLQTINTNYQNSKYKIQLCRNFINYGFCPYGEKCQYAHGTQQLRYTHLAETHQNMINPQSLSSNYQYKTKPCRQFHKKGYCSYGQTCNYLHNKAANCLLPKKSGIDINKVKDQGFKEIIRNGRNKSRIIEIIGGKIDQKIEKGYPYF